MPLLVHGAVPVSSAVSATIWRITVDAVQGDGEQVQLTEMTLLDGKTKAVEWPAAGFNCRVDI